MTCNGFQQAIEQELRGVLADPERASLTDHLAGCDGCRAYRTTAMTTIGAMAARAGEALRLVDWSRVERGRRRWLFDAVAAVAAAVLGAAFLAALTWLTAAPAFRREQLWGVGAVLLGAAALVALVMGYAAWALARLDRGEELLVLHRLGLRARLTFARALPWAEALLACLFAWRAAIGDSTRLHTPAFYGVLAVIMAGLGLYTRLVELPRALREQADLDPCRKA